MDQRTAGIGQRLRAIRKDRMLTQEDLAEAAGVSRDLVAKLEQDVRSGARIKSLAALAEALVVCLS